MPQRHLLLPRQDRRGSHRVRRAADCRPGREPFLPARQLYGPSLLLRFAVVWGSSIMTNMIDQIFRREPPQVFAQSVRAFRPTPAGTMDSGIA